MLRLTINLMLDGSFSSRSRLFETNEKNAIHCGHIENMHSISMQTA